MGHLNSYRHFPYSHLTQITFISLLTGFGDGFRKHLAIKYGTIRIVQEYLTCPC